MLKEINLNIYNFLEKYYHCPICNYECTLYACFYNSLLVTKTNNNYNFGSYSIAPSSFISKGSNLDRFYFNGKCYDSNHCFSFYSTEYKNNFEIELKWFFIHYNNLILNVSHGSEENLYNINIKFKENNKIIFAEEDSKFIDPKECFKILKKVIDNEIFL